MREGYLTPPVIIILALITFGVAITLFFNANLLKNIKNQPTPTPVISSFEECVRAGNRILLTYPRQCKTPDGKSFTEIINETANPSSKASATEDWKTYKGDDFKVEFQYPSSWSIVVERKESVSLGSPDKNVLLV